MGGSGEPPALSGWNREADCRGQKRTNATHASTTDPQAAALSRGPRKKAKLCFMGHALMENHNGLVDACLTEANGHAQRITALHMIGPCADRPRPITLGADEGYDAEDFVNELRPLEVGLDVAYARDSIGVRWAGSDEGDEVQGEGTAELLEDRTIEIEFAYDNGDEAVLKAKRPTSSTEQPQRDGRQF